MSAGFSLPMRDGERTETVIVTLEAFDPARPAVREALRSGRAEIEAAARQKYERGEIAADDRILMLPQDLRRRN